MNHIANSARSDKRAGGPNKTRRNTNISLSLLGGTLPNAIENYHMFGVGEESTCIKGSGNAKTVTPGERRGRKSPKMMFIYDAFLDNDKS
jgi:hypothetical protein